MTDVLISAAELADLVPKEPCVIVDTRNPDAYAAGHLPGAVNVHEIFTYLATSTPEGIAELKTKFAEAFGNACCHLRAVDELRLRPIVPWLLPAEHAGLSEDQGVARRFRCLGDGRIARHD
jgi:rhodanese-related sulfurtransferase